MVSDSDSDAKIVDYDLSESQVRDALREFSVPNHEINGLMIRVMQLVTSREFYEGKEDVSAIPDYGFRIHDIITALDMAENSRESVRKQVLKPLRPKGILGYTEPAPNSPHTHYYLSQEFREHLKNIALEEVISEPDQAEEEERTVELPYHDEALNRAPGAHTQLIAAGLKELIPMVAEDPLLVHEGLDKTERENVEAKKLPIEFEGFTFQLSVYPDAIVFDSETRVLYLLEAVTNMGPFSNRRINQVIESFENGTQNIQDWNTKRNQEFDFELVFITMFPDERRYRNHLMALGDKSYVWLADHKEELRSHGRIPLQANHDGGKQLEFRYKVSL